MTDKEKLEAWVANNNLTSPMQVWPMIEKLVEALEFYETSEEYDVALIALKEFREVLNG